MRASRLAMRLALESAKSEAQLAVTEAQAEATVAKAEAAAASATATVLMAAKDNESEEQTAAQQALEARLATQEAAHALVHGN